MNTRALLYGFGRKESTLAKYSIADDIQSRYKNKGKIISGREAFYKYNEPPYWISTGIRPLDMAIGGKGVPGGKIILVSADATVGKTLLGLHIGRQFQQYKVPGAFHYISPEKGALASWVEGLGVDLSRDMLMQPDFLRSHEDLFEYIEFTGLRHKKKEPKRPIFYFIDSITAFLPHATLEKKYTDAFKQKGNDAAVISGGIKKLELALMDSMCTLLFISQLRSKISMDPRHPIIGDPQTVTGGASLGYHNSLHLRLRGVPGGDIYEYEGAKKKDRIHEQAGTETEIFVYKSRISPPHYKAFVPILWEETEEHPAGFDVERADLNWLLDRELVWKYEGADKSLRKANACEVKLASGVYNFVGMPGWRKIQADPKLFAETGELMKANAQVRCKKDDKMEKVQSFVPKSEDVDDEVDRAINEMDKMEDDSPPDFEEGE